MKVTIAVGLAILYLLLAVGCVTAPPPPRGSSDTLLTGRLIFTLTGFRRYGAASLNGTQTSGVVITLRNVYSNATIQTETQAPKGIFFVSGAKPGEYQISRVYYRQTVGKAWAYAYLRPRTTIQFRIEPGEVSDIGLVDARLDHSGDGSVVSGTGFAQVKSEFAKLFPKSPWDSASWRQVSLFPPTAS